MRKQPMDGPWIQRNFRIQFNEDFDSSIHVKHYSKSSGLPSDFNLNIPNSITMLLLVLIREYLDMIIP
jgi:hypothetical protein